MKIVVITSGSPHHRYLASELRTNFDNVLIIEEDPAYLRKRRRRLRHWTAYAYDLYHYWRRSILGLKRYRSRYFAIPERQRKDMWANTICCDSVNESNTIREITNFDPDIVIICGISILTPKTLKRIPTRILNIHGGFLPYYRGNHCFFFAMWEEQWDKLGSTIHYVDRGIDTGDIVEVIKVPAGDNDIPETLYCRADRAAIHRLVELLKGLSRGVELPALTQGERRPLFNTRDRTLLMELRFWWRWPRRTPWGWFRRIDFNK